MLRASVSLMILIGVVAGSGCSSEEPPPSPVPVTGKVTLDGKPLSSAQLTFIPRGSTKARDSRGMTDETGEYILKQTPEQEGAAPGDYQVTISRYVLGNGQPPPPGADGSAGAAFESLPAKYSSVLESKLSAKVPDDGGNFDFDLTSK